VRSTRSPATSLTGLTDQQISQKRSKGKEASGDPACGLYYQVLQHHSRGQVVRKGTGKPGSRPPKTQWFFGEPEIFLPEYAFRVRHDLAVMEEKYEKDGLDGI